MFVVKSLGIKGHSSFLEHHVSCTLYNHTGRALPPCVPVCLLIQDAEQFTAVFSSLLSGLCTDFYWK